MMFHPPAQQQQQNGPTPFLANKILDHLFVGSSFAAEDPEFLETNEITKVVNLADVQQIPKATQYLRTLSFAAAQDGDSVLLDSRDERIAQLVKFVNECADNDSACLIYSTRGDSRAVVMAAAYLVHRYHWPPTSAINFIACKRPHCFPNAKYIQQLNEFAQRRRTKYGDFKDIFGDITGMTLSFVELLHRNTYLNQMHKNSNVVYDVVQESAVEILEKLNLIKIDKHVRFADGDSIRQVPAQCGLFDKFGKPQHPQIYCKLFRPKSPSYSQYQQITGVPVRVDDEVLPQCSFDIGIQGSHVRRQDGYLQSSNKALAEAATVGRPVSVLRRLNSQSRLLYKKEGTYSSVDEYQQQVQQFIESRDKSQAPATPLAVQTQKLTGEITESQGIRKPPQSSKHNRPKLLLEDDFDIDPAPVEQPTQQFKPQPSPTRQPSQPPRVFTQSLLFNQGNVTQKPLSAPAKSRQNTQQSSQNQFSSGYGIQQSPYTKQAMSKFRPQTPPKHRDDASSIMMHEISMQQQKEQKLQQNAKNLQQNIMFSQKINSKPQSRSTDIYGFGSTKSGLYQNRWK